MSKQITDSALVKTLKISEETHGRLAKLGSVGQTFEDVIKSLLDEHDDKIKKEK
jgi:predicted CopG family antitoxin